MIVNACWVGSRVREEDAVWSIARSRLRDRDKSLAPEAVAWLDSLPHLLRPIDLTTRYPRIANRLALLWPDAHLTEIYFLSLLVDKRGGRRGFASHITEELMALRSYYAELSGRSGLLDPAREQLMAMLKAVLERAERDGRDVEPGSQDAVGAAAASGREARAASLAIAREVAADPESWTLV